MLINKDPTIFATVKKNYIEIRNFSKWYDIYYCIILTLVLK